MNEMLLVILGLLSLLIFQQVYYMITINKLLNKLMSRDYREYVQSSNLSTPQERKQRLDHDPVVDSSEISQLVSI